MCKCINSSKHGHLSLSNVFKKYNTKIRKLNGDSILHGEPRLLIYLMLSFSEGFHSLPYHNILHLILGNSSMLCIVQRSRA